MSEPSREPDVTGDENLLAALADEFAARLRRGESATVDEYISKHPELAERIRSVFPAIAMIEDSQTTEPRVGSERLGSTIGRYKLLERIGEGGFGVVYMAEQLHPVRRKVALKVIKPGIDTRQVIARFEAERQALALMDHENIARVLDAGATDSGRPYFVMELVHGVPITEYCDQNQLPPRGRLELFAQVCRAVQHAHTKGIIHRDIKPTNVLVTLHEGVAVPKVIDFGVAKATGQQLTELTLFTNFAQIVGTPLYMSPEQAEMTSVDVDTRSDVYSLGVLLYELLTGTTPLDKERLKQAALDEVRRIIREEEPPRPSTRLSTVDALASIAAQRHTEPAKLTKLLRGELDWIVMKALEKERSRRYETAIGLATDVQRYLADEPVLAGPPSAAYRFRRYALKYRKVLVTAASFTALLLAATICSIALASWALRERGHARAQKQSAEANLKRAMDAVDQMLTRVGERQLVNVPQMDLVRGDLLNNALRFYQAFLSEKADSALVRVETARAYNRVGQIQFQLGSLDKSKVAYGQAIALLEKLLVESPDDMNLIGELAWAHQAMGMLHHTTQHWPEAEAAMRQAVALQRRIPMDDPGFQKGREGMALLLSDLIILYRQTGRLDQAETAFRECMAIVDSLLARDPNNVDHLTLQARGYQHVALVYGAQGRTAEAVSASERALALNEQISLAHPEAVPPKGRMAAAYNNLGLVYARHGEHDKAEAAYRQSLAIKEALLRDSPNVVSNMVEVAGAYGNIATQVRRRSPEEALELVAKSITILESVLEKEPRQVEARMGLFDGLMGRAYAFRRLGRLDDAASDWRRAIQISEGKNHHINMRLYRPLVLVFLGEHAQAAGEVEALITEGHAQTPNLVLFASIYSLGSKAVANDQRVELGWRDGLVERYRARAVELLKLAAAAGHFARPGQLQNLKTSDDFEPLRSRPDFISVLTDVEKSAPSTLPNSPGR